VFRVARDASPGAVAAPPSPAAPARPAAAAPAAPGPPPIPAAPPRAQALDVELENPFKPPAVPPPLPPSLPPSPEPDPFAGAAFGPPLAAAAPDPFASARADDPFAIAARAPDPFAAAPSGARETRASGGPLPVTDLSDLLGGATAAVPRPAPAALDALDPGDAREVQRAAADREPAWAAALSDGGIALEERSTPEPLRAAPAQPAEADGPALADPFGGPGDPAPPSFGAFQLPETEPAPPRSPPESHEPPRVEVEPPAVAVEPPEPRARPSTPATATPADPRVSRPRVSRARAVLVNAVALVALLAMTLAILVVWRSRGNVDASSFRPSEILAALGGGGAGGPFAVQDLRSGAYERERAAPVLFVRGKVLSRAPGPVPAVNVAVEVVRGGEVVARGEALAGAVPTPEELWRSADAAALASVRRAAAARAPSRILPGEAVPFLVAIDGAPADVEGASLRIAAGAAEGARP
jgi:Meckel syndrome type 1 protein